MWDSASARRAAPVLAPEVKRRIMLGTYALSAGYYDAYYGQAQKVRTLIKRDFEQAFEQVDVIAAPVAPTTAFRIGEHGDDPLAMYLEDVFTLPANLAGVPGLAFPVGFDARRAAGRHAVDGPAFPRGRCSSAPRTPTSKSPTGTSESADPLVFSDTKITNQLFSTINRFTPLGGSYAENH